MGDCAEAEAVLKRGVICISGRFTTAREPRDSGCSGSEMVDIKSSTQKTFVSMAKRSI
jgi:hypothetical protein